MGDIVGLLTARDGDRAVLPAVCGRNSCCQRTKTPEKTKPSAHSHMSKSQERSFGPEPPLDILVQVHTR